MAYINLPVRSDLEAYDFEIDLEGVTWTLGFNYNRRGAFWSMSISKSDDTLILSGLPVLANEIINGRFPAGDGSLPPGAFFSFDTTGKSRDPDNTSFGKDVWMIYRESTTVDV